MVYPQGKSTNINLYFKYKEFEWKSDEILH